MKNVLLIGGGGTLGGYTAEELVKNGCHVDVIGLGENPFDDENISYYQMRADYDALKAFLEGKHYDGLVDFIWYPDADEYPKFHRLLAPHTDHHIFLSSYRVYGNLQHPLTESAPRLLDCMDDEEFLAKDDYGVAKAKCENYLMQSEYRNWTVVRPVISSSMYRFDLINESGDMLLTAAEKKQTVKLPASCRYLTAGVDWAGNSGKLIARLLFKKENMCRFFTIGSGENLTWDTVAGYYAELLGLSFEWVSDEEYLNVSIRPRFKHDWIFLYDRKYSRDIDNSAVLAGTGLTKQDLLPLKEGIILELKKYREHFGK